MMGNSSSSAGLFPTIRGQFLGLVCNFCFMAHRDLTLGERFETKLAKGKVSVRCHDLFLEQFELMLVLADGYRHVIERHRGRVTLPFLSAGETEAQGGGPGAAPAHRDALPTHSQSLPALTGPTGCCSPSGWWPRCPVSFLLGLSVPPQPERNELAPKKSRVRPSLPPIPPPAPVQSHSLRVRKQLPSGKTSPELPSNTNSSGFYIER